VQAAATRPHMAADAVVLIAGGVGITPISALAYALLLGPRHDRRDRTKQTASLPPKRRPPRDLEATLLQHGTLSTTDALSAEAAATAAAAAAALSDASDGCGDGGQQAVWLVWTVRSVQLLVDFLPLLERVHAAPHAHLRIHLTCDGSLETVPPWLRGCVHATRPDVGAVLAECARDGARVHVCTCGPAPMERAVGAACEVRCRKGGDVHLVQMTSHL
jgi:ferredoxin-NADP reductase